MTTNSSSQSISPPMSRQVVSAKVPVQGGPAPAGGGQNTKKKDVYSRYFVATTSLALMVVVSYFILTGPFSTAIRATVAPVVNESASLLFAYPLTIKANGEDTSLIDVFVADREGRPIPNKGVTVESTSGVVSPENSMTDASGHARFELTMDEPGTTEISLSVDSVPLTKRITVKGE